MPEERRNRKGQQMRGNVSNTIVSSKTGESGNSGPSLTDESCQGRKEEQSKRVLSP